MTTKQAFTKRWSINSNVVPLINQYFPIPCLIIPILHPNSQFPPMKMEKQRDHTTSSHKSKTQSPARSSPSTDSISSDHGSPVADNRDPPRAPAVFINRSVHGPEAVVTKVDLEGLSGGVVEEGRSGGGGDGGEDSFRRSKPERPMLRRGKSRSVAVRGLGLGFRVSGMVFCMIAFSVMVADKNQGWTLDSFDRYKEFRYIVGVNIIGFVYSALQVCDLGFHLSSSYSVTHHYLRFTLDFFLDQALTYLLVSASSSAATRVEDWKSNWGKDKFPEMAGASVGMSFMAFFALAANSLISGYTLCSSIDE